MIELSDTQSQCKCLTWVGCTNNNQELWQQVKLATLELFTNLEVVSNISQRLIMRTCRTKRAMSELFWWVGSFSCKRLKESLIKIGD